MGTYLVTVFIEYSGMHKRVIEVEAEDEAHAEEAALAIASDDDQFTGLEIDKSLSKYSPTISKQAG